MSTDAKPELFKAIIGLQAELPKIVKGETARVDGRDGKQGYSYKYADLADISAQILPLLSKHGLAFTANPTVANGMFGLDYELVHESGESNGGFYPLPDPRQTAPQQVGSAITYARRYSLCAATGIAPDGDDDDAAAAQTGFRSAGEAFQNASPNRPAPPQPEPLPADDPWRPRVDGVQSVADADAVLGELRQLVNDQEMSADRAAQVKAALDVRVGEIRRQRPTASPGAQPKAKQEPQDDRAFVDQFRATLKNASVLSDLDGKRGMLGKAIADRRITSPTGTALSAEYDARRRELQAQEAETAGAGR